MTPPPIDILGHLSRSNASRAPRAPRDDRPGPGPGGCVYYLEGLRGKPEFRIACTCELSQTRSWFKRYKIPDIGIYTTESGLGEIRDENAKCACFFRNASPPFGLVQTSPGSPSHRSKRVVSYGSAHEPRIANGRGFAVHRPLGGGSASHIRNQVEADYHQVAV